MGRLVQGIINITAAGFGIFIILAQDVGLVHVYGKTLMVLGGVGIIMLGVGTLLSSRGEHADIHSKNLHLLYFSFVILFGVLTYFKGELFVEYISAALV